MGTERYDWRAEVRKRLGIEVEDPDYTDPCVASRPVMRALYEHARETLGIPTTPPEPTDEELLDEVDPVLGADWAVAPYRIARAFNEATRRGEEVAVWLDGGEWKARMGDEHGPNELGDGPTPADALRSALAAWLRAEWRQKQEGGSDE